jgi:hypothetical protein
MQKKIIGYQKLFQEVEKLKNKFNTLTETDILTEKYVRDELCKEVNGQTEYILPSGDRIDVITKNAIYEVKTPELYKSAIGQLIIYSQYFPNHKKILYLTKIASPRKMQYILRDCQNQNIFTQLFSQ